MTRLLILTMLPLSLYALAGCRRPRPAAVIMATTQWNCIRLAVSEIACSKNGEQPAAYIVPVSLGAVATPWQGMPCLLDDSGRVFCAKDQCLSKFVQVSPPEQRYDRIIGTDGGFIAQSGKREFMHGEFDPFKADYTIVFYSALVFKDADAHVFAYEIAYQSSLAFEDRAKGSYEITMMGEPVELGTTDPILQQANWRLGVAFSQVCRTNSSSMCAAAKASIRSNLTEAAGEIVKIDLGTHHGCWLTARGAAFCFGERATDTCKIGSVADLSIGPLNTCVSFEDGQFQCWPHDDGGGLRTLCESHFSATT